MVANIVLRFIILYVSVGGDNFKNSVVFRSLLFTAWHGTLIVQSKTMKLKTLKIEIYVKHTF